MKKWPWFLLALFIIVIDQVTKHWALMTLEPYQPLSLGPMINLTLAYNSGVAFSFLNNVGEWHRWFLPAFSFGMSIVLVVWMLRLASIERLELCAISLILGGAIGNLIDRIMHGYVIDFIDVYYKTHHWPVFNGADSAICIGAFLLLMAHFKHKNAPI